MKLQREFKVKLQKILINQNLLDWFIINIVEKMKIKKQFHLSFRHFVNDDLLIESLNKKYNTNYSKGDILIYNFESLDKVKDEIKYLFSNFIDVNKGFSKLSVVLHLDDNSERQGYVGITFDEDSKDSEINFSLYGDSQMDISNIENHIGAKLEPLKL